MNRSRSIVTVILGAFTSFVLSSFVQVFAAPNVYFGNLHSHTSYSDGSGTPTEAYRYARNVAHLDFLAVTEHNHSKAEQGIPKDQQRKDGILIAKDHSLYDGAQQKSLISAAKKANVDNIFVAIYGQEFSTISSGNHVNVFEIGEVIDEVEVPNGEFKVLLDWVETKPDSQQLPAIVQFNHPSKQYRDRSIEYGFDDFSSPKEWQDRMSQHVRLIEVLNGPGTKNATGQTPTVTQSDYLYYLNEGFKLAPTGDQDNHWKNWGRSTEARTGVIADALTKPKILGALRNRHVYATEDKNLKLIFYVNGHLCGDIVSPPPEGSELNIQYSIVDEDEADANYKIEVFSDEPGGDVATVVETITDHGNSPPENLKLIEDVHFTGEHQYLFFKITQTDEDENSDRAWTAPVWLEATAPVSPMATATPSGDFVASKNSQIYHVASCRLAKGIKDKNKITGSEATKGRSLHQGCPVP
jgi:hypothetical protein